VPSGGHVGGALHQAALGGVLDQAHLVRREVDVR